MRSKRSEWYIESVNEKGTTSIDNFLNRLKTPGRDFFQLSFYRRNPKNNKISSLSIKIDKTSQSEYITWFTFGSQSKNEDIYNNFKKFGEEEKLPIAYGDNGKDGITTLITDKFSNPADVGPYIQLCNEYDSTIPLEILIDLKSACGIPLIPSKKEFEEVIHENGYVHALKQADAFCKYKDLYIISLADVLFDKYSYEDATECYKLITKQDMNLYKKAQYQLGSMIFNFTSVEEYDSPRDHASAALPYIAEADDYGDSINLAKRLFNCICTGSYNLGNCRVPYPSADGILELGDYIYSIHKKANVTKKEYTGIYSVAECKQTLFECQNQDSPQKNPKNNGPHFRRPGLG